MEVICHCYKYANPLLMLIYFADGVADCKAIELSTLGSPSHWLVSGLGKGKYATVPVDMILFFILSGGRSAYQHSPIDSGRLQGSDDLNVTARNMKSLSSKSSKGDQQQMRRMCRFSAGVNLHSIEYINPFSTKQQVMCLLLLHTGHTSLNSQLRIWVTAAWLLLPGYYCRA